jgi:general stress protein 26
MMRADGEKAQKVGRLLAGAAQVVAEVHYCWLIVPSDEGMPSARPMGRLMGELGDADWVIRFVVDSGSRKAAALRRAGVLALTFQKGADDAFVLLTGKATLLSEPADVRRHWRSGFSAYFPTAEDQARAAFIELRVARMELWIRGVTPEPFGMRPTTLERGADGAWRLP